MPRLASASLRFRSCSSVAGHGQPISFGLCPGDDPVAGSEALLELNDFLER